MIVSSFGCHDPRVAIYGPFPARPLVDERVAASEVGASQKPLELRALFDAHYASIWRLLRRLGVDEAHVDDAAQEVFWIAARRLADIRADRAHSFLYGVALRVASQERRKRQARPTVAEFDDVDALVDHAPSADVELDRRRALATLDAILDRMAPELRTAFVLFELEGLEVRAIAELEEIPLGTAASRLRRAREEFQAIGKRFAAARRGR